MEYAVKGVTIDDSVGLTIACNSEVVCDVEITSGSCMRNSGSLRSVCIVSESRTYSTGTESRPTVCGRFSLCRREMYNLSYDKNM